MTPLRVLTVDDEMLALKRLKLLLQTIPKAEHVGEAASCAEAIAKINQLRPEVVLLDIKMRDGNGFEVVEAVAQRPNPPLIIFVTAFDQYAAQAFDSAVTDYLLKPVERERLARALLKAERQLHIKDAELRVDELQQVLRNLRAARNGDGQQEFETEFWLRGSGGLVRVPVDAIDCVSSADEYVAIHTASGSHLMRGSIRQFAERVEPGLFVRIHRRWLVRQSAISELCTGKIGRTEVVLRNGKRLPAGRVHLKQLRQSIQAMTRH
jgi:two-component system LytT family response regulator